MSQSRDSETPSPQEEAGSSNTRTWKLEESSLWWLSLDVFQHPGNVLLMSSIPFVAGAFFGYKKPTEKLEELAGGRKRKKKKTDKVDVAALAEHRRLGLQTASRALRLATLGAVGSFGMLGAVGFYAFGYRSVDEAITTTTRWASSWREGFENWLAMEDRPSKTHPEVIATKHMDEDEEMNYLYENYIREPEEKPDTTQALEESNDSGVEAS